MVFNPATDNLPPVSTNTRVFYACQAVMIQAIGENRTDANNVKRIYNDTLQYKNLIHGVQSIGINSNFNLEQVFELGQIYIYENIEGIPEVEITIEKVLDGHQLIYLQATEGVGLSIPTIPVLQRDTLLARSRERCDVTIGIFKETEASIANSSNKQEMEVTCTGMYVSSISYTFPTDGNCTESVTLVGNHKTWSTSQSVKNLALNRWNTVPPTNGVDGYDIPNSGIQTGIGGTVRWEGVTRRENIKISRCRFPPIIPGAALKTQPTDLNNCKIQNISISCDLGREDVFVLGSKMPYIKTANYPVEVTCDIEVLANAVDSINVGEEYNKTSNQYLHTYSVEDSPLVIVLDNGTRFELGRVKLSSVSYSGGDAGGGNATTTYSFIGYNVLDIVRGPFINIPGT